LCRRSTQSLHPSQSSRSFGLWSVSTLDTRVQLAPSTTTIGHLVTHRHSHSSPLSPEIPVGFTVLSLSTKGVPACLSGRMRSQSLSEPLSASPSSPPKRAFELYVRRISFSSFRTRLRICRGTRRSDDERLSGSCPLSWNPDLACLRQSKLTVVGQNLAASRPHGSLTMRVVSSKPATTTKRSA
jgi:hypothetical protein